MFTNVTFKNVGDVPRRTLFRVVVVTYMTLEYGMILDKYVYSPAHAFHVLSSLICTSPWGCWNPRNLPIVTIM